MTAAAARVCLYKSRDEWQADKDNQKLDLDQPFAVLACSKIVKSRFECADIRADVDFFESAINNKAHDPKFFRGRGFPDASAMTDVLAEMQGFVPVEPQLHGAHRLGIGSLEEQLGNSKDFNKRCTVCAIADGAHVHIGFEYDDMGSCRVMLKGQRDVLMIDAVAIHEWLQVRRSDSGNQVADGHIEALEVFWQKTPLDKHWMLEFIRVQPASVHFIVHGVPDMLYCPQGWLILTRSRSHAKLPAFCFRAPVWTNAPKGVAAMTKLAKGSTVRMKDLQKLAKLASAAIPATMAMMKDLRKLAELASAAIPATMAIDESSQSEGKKESQAASLASEERPDGSQTRIAAVEGEGEVTHIGEGDDKSPTGDDATAKGAPAAPAEGDKKDDKADEEKSDKAEEEKPKEDAEEKNEEGEEKEQKPKEDAEEKNPEGEDKDEEEDEKEKEDTKEKSEEEKEENAKKSGEEANKAVEEEKRAAAELAAATASG